MGDRWIATRRLALTEDGRVVDEGHPDGRWLYAVPGQSVPLAEAERYGLTATDGPAETEPAEEPPAEPVEDAAPEPVKPARARKAKG